MKFLISGCTGFLGTNLALYFADKGHNIYGIDSSYKSRGLFQNRSELDKRSVIVLHADIRNQNDVENIFAAHGPFDVILHMAAQVAFKSSVENPRFDFETNLLGTFNILEASRKLSPAACIVYASTNQVYGDMKEEPVLEFPKRFDFANLQKGVPESSKMDFLSPYGCSKGGAEMYVRDYARVYGLRTIVARFGGIYGVKQYSYEEHGWISYICEQVLKNRPFNRFGHGKQVRDILYITDIQSAVEKMIERIDDIKGDVINIGGGPDNSISVLELLDVSEKITGNKEKSIINPMRSADKLVMYLNIDKAKLLLDWSPKINRDEGIKLLIEWLERSV